MSALKKMNKAIEKFENAKKEMQETGKSLFGEAVLEVMRKYPEVTAIQWQQYTPYFNDGDACEFRVCDPQIKTKESDVFQDSYDMEESDSSYKLFDDLNELLSSEDLLETVFGDHVEITVKVNGEIKVDEYSHD